MKIIYNPAILITLKVRFGTLYSVNKLRTFWEDTNTTNYDLKRVSLTYTIL